MLDPMRNRTPDQTRDPRRDQTWLCPGMSPCCTCARTPRRGFRPRSHASLSRRVRPRTLVRRCVSMSGSRLHGRHPRVARQRGLGTLNFARAPRKQQPHIGALRSQPMCAHVEAFSIRPKLTRARRAADPTRLRLCVRTRGHDATAYRFRDERDGLRFGPGPLATGRSVRIRAKGALEFWAGVADGRVSASVVHHRYQLQQQSTCLENRAQALAWVV